MRKFMLSILLLIVIFGYLSIHDRKKDFTPIGDTGFISFVEKIDGVNLMGICDSNNNVLRPAKYLYVDGKKGFVVGSDAEREDIDIILANGDSVLCDVDLSSYVFDTDVPIPYLLATDKDGQEYIVLSGGQVIGPGKNLSVCFRQKVVLTCNDGWGVCSFDNKPVLPAFYQKIIFVNRSEKTDDNKTDEKTDYLLAFRCGRWHKFSPEGESLDTVPAAFADTLLQNPACEMQTGNAVFSIRL